MSQLCVNNLACIKRDRLLFDAVCFSLQAGDILHLQGPNGAGKTSLLRILVGLSEPQSGSVQWHGAPISQDRAAYHRQLIYFGHKPGVNLALSARENLRYWCDLQGVAQPLDIYSLLDSLGLVGLEDLPASQLSAGQQRRIGLARLWLKSARLWVLDEPFTALDRHAVTLLKQRMQMHLGEGGMIVLTSHQSLEWAGQLKTLHLEYRI
ncbi:cytochrome c biogenesis heme-transporting ATPase CcmA [Bowmanella dokdonensis]|uniref:Cytochrome c biogenesis heme-transporting ATPase CcmA n=1 Tax=Bowmanella dokdonensis TaxID=751969 RepID=A0A939DPD0_9ALTE|nr:cytochrome c biogenesis heme-transporting ATPase CcmA [Bowmanella dokdonensis]